MSDLLCRPGAEQQVNSSCYLLNLPLAVPAQNQASSALACLPWLTSCNCCTLARGGFGTLLHTVRHKEDADLSLHAVIGLSPLLSQTGEVKSADNKGLEQWGVS